MCFVLFCLFLPHNPSTVFSGVRPGCLPRTCNPLATAKALLKWTPCSEDLVLTTALLLLCTCPTSSAHLYSRALFPACLATMDKFWAQEPREVSHQSVGCNDTFSSEIQLQLWERPPSSNCIILWVFFLSPRVAFRVPFTSIYSLSYRSLIILCIILPQLKLLWFLLLTEPCLIYNMTSSPTPKYLSHERTGPEFSGFLNLHILYESSANLDIFNHKNLPTFFLTHPLSPLPPELQLYIFQTF